MERYNEYCVCSTTLLERACTICFLHCTGVLVCIGFCRSLLDRDPLTLESAQCTLILNAGKALLNCGEHNENIKSPSKPTCIKWCVTQYLLETTNLNPTVSTIVSPFLLSEGLKSSKLMTYNFGAHSCPGRDMSSLEARVAWVKNQPRGGFGEWSDKKIFQTSFFCFHVNFWGLYG